MKISVALAAYKGEQYIAEQIDSILSQLGENDEIIVSDDYPQGKTREIVLNRQLQDKRIKYIEGSGNKITLVGLPEMEGQKHLILTQTSNMLWATDNKSDESFVDVKRKDHYTLSMAANIFLGTQFHTIDPRRLRIIELFQG